MTDRQTGGQTDARGKTICLPTLKGGDINILVSSCSKNICFIQYILNGFAYESIFIDNIVCYQHIQLIIAPIIQGG